MSTDLVVIYSPVGGGHKSAALAIAEAAKARGLEVKVLDAFDYAPKLLGEAYVRAHLTGQAAFPELYGTAYFAANRRGGKSEVLRRGFDHVAFGNLVNEVRDLAPRAIVATHHLPLVVLGRARRRGILSVPLLGVVTDYTAHAHWAEKGVDGFCVACPLAHRELLAHGVDRERIAMTGIPIRSAFSRANAVLDPGPGEPLRVLLTNGGFGVGPIRAILRSFAGIPNVALTVVCGNAPAVALRVTRYARRFGLDAKIIGFEHDMASRVSEAQVVVGKAGGLTVSETLAAGR
ncbi:MAG: glycosyltransferase, partial [Polyangiaceae bacterium]